VAKSNVTFQRNESKERYRYTGKKELDLKETINHCDIMSKRKQDEKNSEYERCEISIRANSSLVVSLNSRAYRESSFWDAVHGDKVS
jgi:hypothetical protein